MKDLFVDTAGWMACADAADPASLSARAARDRAPERGQFLVTTDCVIDETLTLVRVRLGLAAAEAWWAQVQQAGFETVPPPVRQRKARPPRKRRTADD